MRSRRSKALLLAAALLVLAALAQLGAGPASTGPGYATTQPASAASQPADTIGGGARKADANTLAPLGRPDGNSPFKWQGLGDQTDPMWQMIGMIVIVGVLGLVALWAVRRMRSGALARHGRNISVLETAFLGPHKSVHLLRVGRKEFLVASTRERISMLADVTEGTDSPGGFSLEEDEA